MFPPETTHTTTSLFGEWYKENTWAFQKWKNQNTWAFDFQGMNFVGDFFKIDPLAVHLEELYQNSEQTADSADFHLRHNF